MWQTNLPSSLRRQFASSHPVDICARRDLSLQRNIGGNLTPSLRIAAAIVSASAAAAAAAASASNLCRDSKLQTSPRRDRRAHKTRVMTSGGACAERSASAVKFDRPAKWLKFARDQTGTHTHTQNKQKKSRRFPVAYHFDPALWGSEESQNNSFRTSSPLAMKIAAELSHFSQFLLSPQSFLSPRAAVAFRQTKMQRLLLEKELVIGARGSYGLFCQTFLKGHGTFSFSFFYPERGVPTRRTFLPTGLGATFGPGGRRSFVAQTPSALPVCALCTPATGWRHRGSRWWGGGGRCSGHFSHFSRYRGHRNFICTIMCAHSAKDSIGTGRTGDVIDEQKRQH